MNKPAHRCEACGEPATRQDAEGIWLCEGDYQHLVDHWIAEGFGKQADGGKDAYRVTPCGDDRKPMQPDGGKGAA